MFLRIALFTVPTAAVVGAVLVLDAVHADAGIAVAVLGVIAVLSGSAFGYFADRLPEVPRLRRHRHDRGAAGLAGFRDRPR